MALSALDRGEEQQPLQGHPLHLPQIAITEHYHFISYFLLHKRAMPLFLGPMPVAIAATLASIAFDHLE